MNYNTTEPAISPREKTDVAIIGLAVRLPEADTLDTFLQNLRSGRDSVRYLTNARITRTSLPPNETYQMLGFLDDIDMFDFAFFNLSKGEAKTMSPQHRLLLQTSYHAIENSGYNPMSWKGSRTSVYIADTKIGYDSLARVPEPTLLMGSHVSAMAGRISRFFGFRGPAAMIDTACSSSLVAMHFAMNDLVYGESDIALVGAASLNLFAVRLMGDVDIGIRSPDGKTRCFSADAAGTGSGEAIVVAVLKRLEDAQRDGDLIHAILKSVAVNHVGGRASTLTAPDAESQAECIERAWTQARIDPLTVSYIEAHGTATRLGDPIEIEGINQAFAKVTTEKQFCEISSVKSNLGHTWSASGLVGVVKAVLALRHRQLFPNLHTSNLSPLIDFANSAVTVTQECQPWNPSCGVRCVGVSSFGVMGTNAHAILEEADASPHIAPSTNSCEERKYWFPMSARSAAALESNISTLLSWLQARIHLDCADVQRTLVEGRNHFEHRFSVTATNLQQLMLALASYNPHLERVKSQDREDAGVALLFSGQCQASPDIVKALRGVYAHFDCLYTQCESASAGLSHPQVAQFAFQFAMHGLLRELGFKFAHLLSEGQGRQVVAAILGRATLADAIRESCNHKPDDLPLSTRVLRFLSGFKGQRLIFIEAGPLSTLSALLQEKDFLATVRSTELAVEYDVIAMNPEAIDFPSFLSTLYLNGLDWDFAKTAGDGWRIELPGYQFEKHRCWLDDVKEQSTTVQTDESLDVGKTAPLMDTAPEVSRLLQEILGLDELDPTASFFSLGGDSIAGLQLANSINALFGIQLDHFAIFDHSTLLDLVEVVEKLRAATATTQDADKYISQQQPTTSKTAAQELFPCSQAQLQIWLAAQFEGGSIAFNLTRSFKLTGQFNVERLQCAINALVSRHEALRATFRLIDETLMQRIAPTFEVKTLLEYVQLDNSQSKDYAQKCVLEFAARPFDLENGLLFRVQIVSLAENTHILTLSTHHVVVDGWSLDLLIRDLSFLLINDGASLPAITTSYRQQFMNMGKGRQEGGTASKDYWLTQFAQVPSLIELPTSSQRHKAAFQGAYLDCQLPTPLGTRLKAFSRENSGTSFTALLALFAAYFSRYTEDGQLILGTSLIDRGGKAVEQLVSMLVQTVPLRFAVLPTASLRELHTQVLATFSEAVRHRFYPYEELVQELQRQGKLNSANLFNVLIEFEQFGEVRKAASTFLAGSGIEVEPLEVHLDTSVFPLNIMLSEQPDSFHAVFRFDKRQFDQKLIECMWHDFVELMQVLLDHQNQPIGKLPLLTAPEAQRVRTLGYRSHSFDPSRLVHQEIERYAVTWPDRECLSYPDGTSTFSQLNRRANQLAHMFRYHYGISSGDIVALVMDCSKLLVESILAVWKCGAAYVPVDPRYPSTFMTSMFGSAQVKMAMYDPRQLEATAANHLAAAGHKVVALTEKSGEQENTSNLDLNVAEIDLAYVIFTSGSTGTPKGVMIEHLGMLNHLHTKVIDIQLSEQSIVAQNARSSFDISIWQTFAAPFIGGRSVIYPQCVQLDPQLFTNQIEADAVTVLEVVPSYLSTMLDVWEQVSSYPKFNALKYLLVTGEEVHPHLVNRWLHQFPNVPIVNAYGPTEASDDITHHIITKPIDRSSVPVGRPILNSYIYILDAERRVLPEGSIGDIYVSGICVGRGYLDDPEQTNRVFTEDPFEPGRRMYRTGDQGCWTSEVTLEFYGRKDNQVKVRGFRIDLGEIERCLIECPDVKSAAVVTAAEEKDQLCAFVVLHFQGSIDNCRIFLMQRLPNHMVPGMFWEIDKLPLTNNGKIDRKTLAKRVSAGNNYNNGLANVNSRSGSSGDLISHQSALQMLREIWEEVLKRKDFDINDSFFDLGGNSLRAIQVLSRIRNHLQVDLPIEAIFLQPSLSSLAERIVQSKPTDVERIESLGGSGTYPIALTQELLLQIERDYVERAAFNRNDLYRVHGQFDEEIFTKAVANLIEQHEALRTTFHMQSGEPVQVVHEAGVLPLPLRTHDFSHTEDSEAALKQLVERQIKIPFDIYQEPLVRIDLIKTDPGIFTLLISLHQLISDGRSAQVFEEDLLRHYEAVFHNRSLPPRTPLVQPKDTATWQRQNLSQEKKKQLRTFWMSQLAGATLMIKLPIDRVRPQMATINGSRLYIRYPDVLTQKFAALARHVGCTEFVVVQAAVSLLALACTGGQDVTIGTYTRGRDRLELENQIGFNINTVPLRLQLQPEESLHELLNRLYGNLLKAFEYQAYPYGWTMGDLGWQRGVDRSPLFDIMVALDDLSSEQEENRESLLWLEVMDLPRRSKEADLLFAFGRTNDSLQLALTYNVDIFSPNLARRYAERVGEILTAMLEGRSIEEILELGRIISYRSRNRG